MIIRHYHKGREYFLSNENLEVEDNVFPIARGKTDEGGAWKRLRFDFDEYSSGFPDSPHRIINLAHSTYKPYQVKTDHGYGPIEMYFKIIQITTV